MQWVHLTFGFRIECYRGMCSDCKELDCFFSPDFSIRVVLNWICFCPFEFLPISSMNSECFVTFPILRCLTTLWIDYGRLLYFIEMNSIDIVYKFIDIDFVKCVVNVSIFTPDQTLLLIYSKVQVSSDLFLLLWALNIEYAVCMKCMYAVCCMHTVCMKEHFSHTERNFGEKSTLIQNINSTNAIKFDWRISSFQFSNLIYIFIIDTSMNKLNTFAQISSSSFWMKKLFQGTSFQIYSIYRPFHFILFGSLFKIRFVEIWLKHRYRISATEWKLCQTESIHI